MPDMQNRPAHRAYCVCSSTKLASQLFSRRCSRPNSQRESAHEEHQAGRSGARLRLIAAQLSLAPSLRLWQVHSSAVLMSAKVVVQVLTAGPHGRRAFETVFMFSHFSAEIVAHVSLTTQSNLSLSLTAGHYLWVTQAGQSRPSIVRAGDVHVGDAAWISSTTTASNDLLMTDTITAIAILEKEGLYNPHTPSGCIIVNGLAALTFTETIPPSCLWHSIVTLPARALFSLLPLSVAAHLNHVLLSAYFTFHVHLRSYMMACDELAFQLKTFFRLLTDLLAIAVKAKGFCSFTLTSV